MVDFKKILQKKEPLWLLELPDGVRPTHYMTLLVPPGAPREVLESRYRHLRVLHHPDRHHDGNAQEHAAVFACVTEAYAVIGHEESRRQYDRELALLGPKPCGLCMGAGLREFTGRNFRKEQRLCDTCRGTGQKL